LSLPSLRQSLSTPLLRPSPCRCRPLHPHGKTCRCLRSLPPQRQRIGGAGVACHASTARCRDRIPAAPSHRRLSFC
jgi:hypothetical protein